MFKVRSVLSIITLLIIVISGCYIEDTKIVYRSTNDHWRALYKKYLPSIPALVILGAKDGEEPSPVGHCSGWVIGDGFVATNYHCVDNYYNPDLDDFPSVRRFGICAEYPETAADLKNGESPPWHCVESAYRDLENRDLAIIKINTAGRRAIPMANDYFLRAQPLEEVMAIGYPLSFSESVTVGEINNVFTNAFVGLGWIDEDTKLYKISSVIDRGNSGGPLFNFAGEVIGINTALAKAGGPSHFLSVSTDYFGNRGAPKHLESMTFTAPPDDYDEFTREKTLFDDNEEIAEPYESNSHTFYLEEDRIYLFRTTEPTEGYAPEITDTVLILSDPDGNEVDFSDDFSDSLYSSLGIRAGQSGDYELTVVGYDSAYGWYKLLVKEWRKN